MTQLHILFLPDTLRGALICSKKQMRLRGRKERNILLVLSSSDLSRLPGKVFLGSLVRGPHKRPLMLFGEWDLQRKNSGLVPG